MFRRIVSLVMVPCLLLTQSAALGHAHGDSQPAGHDCRPHIHVNFAPAGHTHGHYHGPGEHHHGPGKHHHHPCEAIPDTPTAPPTQHPEPVRDHDSDAAYVNASAAVVVQRSETVVGQVSSVWWTAAFADVFASFWADTRARPAFCSHSPPCSGHICPTYIRHLALLI